ncbi:hypothetical protein QWJ20_15640 [Pectobacterium sp. S5]|uniref:hypothetical protein n=1 Tax=Pectobacterium TaxID=122277 RepID=UPI003D9B15EE
MMVNKDKYTQVILDLAYKIPFVFPKIIGCYAKEYNSKSDYITNKKQEDNHIKLASLFESPFYWQGISFSVFLSSEELLYLRRWQNKHSVFMSSSNGSHIVSKSFDQDNGWANVGFIRINQDTIMDDLFSVYTPNDFFSSINITLTKYSTGLSFLTFYISCNSQVTDLVSSISVPKMNYFVEFESFNVFSRKCHSISMMDYWHHADSIIRRNIINVKSSANELIKHLFNEIGIKKKESDMYCVLDMYADQVSPYFDDSVFSENHQDEHHVLFPKRNKFINSQLSDNSEDVFIENRYLNVSGVDYIYMKVAQRVNNAGVISNLNGYLSIIPVLLMSKKIDLISGYLNSAKLHNRKQSVEKVYESLYDISYQLHMILAWFKSSRRFFLFNMPESFRKNISNIISYQMSRVENLKEVSGEIYTLSNNRIQVSNIKYNKRYSAMVFVLVIIQIILAAMTIDWNKSDTWYSSVINWIKNFV